MLTSPNCCSQSFVIRFIIGKCGIIIWKVNILIYFDNGATTKPYKEVLESFLKVSTDFYGNPSSLHRVGGQAEQLLAEARSQIANLLHVKEKEIIFTSGGTESNNLAVKGAALQYQNRGKHLITSTIEHASVRESLEQLKTDFGFEITYIPVDQTGRINIADLEKAIRDDTILVSIMHVNNEVGTIQPMKEIGTLLQNYPKVIFHVDNVQGIGKVPLNLSECHIDLCSYSAHKFHGLKGNGILYKKETCELSPLFTGGSQEGKHRSGTENVAGIVAMAKALRLTMEKSQIQTNNMIEIRERLRSELGKVAEVFVNTTKQNTAPHIFNFSIPGIKSEVFIHALGEKEIYVSTTSACSSKKKTASNTLLAMGLNEELASSAVRISITYENTLQEANTVIQAIKDTVKKLREVMK